MKLDPEFRQQIKRKKLDEVEASWTSRMESSPRDLEWFLEVAREMRTAKWNTKATELLTLLVDGLATEDAWEKAFEVLSGGLALFPRARELRDKALECVQSRYGDRSDLEDVLAFYDVDNAEDTARAFEGLRDWLRFEKGAGFYLFGRGIGKVAESNLALQKVQVNFEKTAPLMIRRDEAKTLLTWIPPTHFMMRRFDDPEGVRAEARSEPGAIMRELLTSFGRPLTATEIRECMTGVVEGSSFSSWWTKARSHSQVLPSKANKRAFVWSESSAEASEVILDELKSAKFEEKLELAKRHAKRGGTVKEGIVRMLAEELEQIASSGSSDALEVSLLLEELGAHPDPSPISLESILSDPDAGQILGGVRDRRYREKLYARVRTARDAWSDVYRDAFFAERDFRLMTRLYEGLRDHGPEGAAEKLVADSVFSPRRTPRAFVWVTKNCLMREELTARANQSLLSKVVEALDGPEFRDLKMHLREHFEEGGLAFLVFDKSDREGVERLLNLIDSAALEDHRKTEIRRAIFRKYPKIRRRPDEADDVIYVTAESAEAKRGEFEQLVRVDIPENAKAIQTAREYGDLRENFEYHAARQKHELLNSRAAQLNEDLKKMRLIDPGAIDPSKVAIGTLVELEPVGGGPSRRITILGPWDSDVDAGIYSYQSQLAQGILGARPDDRITFDEEDYRIADIRAWQLAPSAGEATETVSD